MQTLISAFVLQTKIIKKYTEHDAFRSTSAWQKKRDEIKERDLYLCRLSELDGNYVYDDLSVHHIEPLEEAWDLRLDNVSVLLPGTQIVIDISLILRKNVKSTLSGYIQIKKT
jgi:5-methylcytosine-specific restriction endonuclease McrA